MYLLQNFHLAVIEYLYRGRPRSAVPLQTFTRRRRRRKIRAQAWSLFARLFNTTRHSNRKLSIVMALSTTFTQCARKLPNSVK